MLDVLEEVNGTMIAMIVYTNQMPRSCPFRDSANSFLSFSRMSCRMNMRGSKLWWFVCGIMNIPQLGLAKNYKHLKYFRYYNLLANSWFVILNDFSSLQATLIYLTTCNHSRYALEAEVLCQITDIQKWETSVKIL